MSCMQKAYVATRWHIYSSTVTTAYNYDIRTHMTTSTGHKDTIHVGVLLIKYFRGLKYMKVFKCCW